MAASAAVAVDSACTTLDKTQVAIDKYNNKKMLEFNDPAGTGAWTRQYEWERQEKKTSDLASSSTTYTFQKSSGNIGRREEANYIATNNCQYIYHLHSPNFLSTT
jgi:hypothetical protein